MNILNKQRHILIILGALAALSGCGPSSSGMRRDFYPDDPQAALAPSAISATSQTAALTETPALVQDPSAIAPGNQIKIACDQDAAVRGTFSVPADGELKLPYGVSISALGLSEAALRAQIVESYKPFFRGTPAIKVAIDRTQALVEVHGLVKKPGTVLVKQDSSLDEIIAQAGGLLEGGAPDTSPRYVSIQHAGGRSMIRLQDYFSGGPQPVPAWHGGEKIFFQSSGNGASVSGTANDAVQIIGMVVSPGEYAYQASGDFFYYLVRAGGPTDRADMQRISLLRKVSNGTEKYTFGTESARELPQIQRGDVILVNADNPSDIEKDSRVLGGFGGVLSAMSTAVLVGLGL